MPSKKRHYMTYLAKCSTLLSNETEPKSIEPNISQIQNFSVSLIIPQTNLIHFICHIIVKFYCIGCMGGFEFKFDDCATYKQGLTLQLCWSVAKVQAPVHIANVQVQSFTFRAGPQAVTISSFFLNNKLFSDTDGKRALMVAFHHCCDIFAYSSVCKESCVRQPGASGILFLTCPTGK